MPNAVRPGKQGQNDQISASKRFPGLAVGGFRLIQSQKRAGQRHKIRAVIPTRKDQPQDPNFDKESYRRRNLIERVVGWFKECRALGTRYEKLAVSYLALWIVAMIDKLLKRR